MRVLVTGGAGYIGSHTCLELLNCGHEVFVVDNLCNSKVESLRRVKKLTDKPLVFYQADIQDEGALREIFAKHAFDAILHFAGYKAVGESVEQPLKYYQNNVLGSVTLLRVMDDFDVRAFVFSSSATVYGDPQSVPIRESFPVYATNPYGRSKLMIEEICRDLHRADDRWNIAILRYFNPVGAHESGLIGEDCRGIPNNLLPYISRVAVGSLKELSVFGDDYDTPDGTGVRDYIHVVDLAVGHVRALEHMSDHGGLNTYNLGTGKGYSVLEVIEAFETASCKAIPYKVVARRPGDIAMCYADPSLAEQQLGWKAKLGIDDMMEDTWRWQVKNKHGFS